MYKSAYVNIDFFKRNTSGSLLCLALHLDFFHLEMGFGECSISHLRIGHIHL